MTRKRSADGGDERVMVRRDGFVQTPPPEKKPKAKPPRQHPQPGRKARGSETIGGPGTGVRPPKGTRIVGNAPCCTLTDEIFDEIVAHVAAGNFRRVAACAAGVPEQKFWNWLTTGREQIQEYIDGKRPDVPRQGQLVIALNRAEGKCFIDVNARILNAGDIEEPTDIDDRKLVFAWLQRRFAREWAAPPTGTDDETGVVKKIDVTELLMDRLKMLLGADADG